MFPLAITLSSLALFVGRKKFAERMIAVGLAFWLGYESVLGAMQLFGLAVSHNNMCPMTGSFANSGPYGGFLSVCIAVTFAMAWELRDSKNLCDRIIFGISVVSCCCGLIMLPASMSRAGFVALGVSATVFALTHKAIISKLNAPRWLTLSVLALMVAAGIVTFCLKKDSALGRLHIWEIEIRAVAEKPLTGYGYGNALGAYGDAQAKYFETKERSQERVRIAGCPEYAFNEYLRFGMEFGILGFLLSVAVLVVGILLLLRVGSPLACGLIVWGTFAFASYPLAVWQLRALLAIFLGAAIGTNMNIGIKLRPFLTSFLLIAVVGLICIWTPGYVRKKEAENEWLDEQSALKLEFYEGVAGRLALLYPQLDANYRYLYDYGYVLHKEGRYAESNEILRKGASLSSDPMFYNIIGKNYESMGDYVEAERNYLHSHYMVPSRLYPYILLMELKEKQGDSEHALGYARKALCLPVNYKNMSMRDLRDRVKEYYDEHSKDN